MSHCTHPYRDSERACPHTPVGESSLCLWHNPAVQKSDAYARDLLAQADVVAQGDLTQFQLVGLVWYGAQLPRRNFRGADLRDAIFDGSDLTGCDFSGAILRRACFKRCTMQGVHLTGADLTGTNFCDSDLSNATITCAIIDGTLLMGADLEGVQLASATIKSFRWNRRTRFNKAISDTEVRSDGDSDAPTQAFLAPLALETSASARSQLLDGDIEDNRTREYIAESESVTPLASLPVTENFGPTKITKIVALPTPQKQWLPWAVAATIAVGGAGVGAWGYAATRGASSVSSTTLADVQQERDNLLTQHEADIAEMRRVQDRAHVAESHAAENIQESTMRRTELESLRAQLRDAELEASRCQSAEDKAALLGVTVQELELINGDIARHGARQERLGRVLSDGVSRLDRERQEAVTALARNQADVQHLLVLEHDVQGLRDQISDTTRERDVLLAQNRKLMSELTVAQGDIERYLARVEGTHLRDVLVGNGVEAALLPIEAGTTLALNGDYLLTLRVDPGAQAGLVQAQIVVQRPPSAANPEITLVLYDAERQPLRRLSYSFPHVDRGAPLVSSTTITACDRFPSFARVQVVPGLDGMTAAR